MMYNDRNNRNRNNQPNQNGPRKQFKLDDSAVLRHPLSEEYKDHARTYLIDGTAYKLAESLKQLPNTQMRKILDVAKEAAVIARTSDNLDAARNKLYSILPMAAYNTGRARNNEKGVYEKLLQLLYNNISPQTIRTAEDIETFDEFFTSIIAYHRFLGGKEKDA